MPYTLVIENLQSKRQRLEFHFFYHLLEWQKYLVGNLGSKEESTVLGETSTAGAKEQEISFVGMAEVLGWEPRAPIVAKFDRKRVLSSWAPYCGNMIPTEYQVEFSKVRHLTPYQFVEKLSKEFGLRGVVAGENYRFGYKAAGDASELVKLCDKYGMSAYIINSVMDQNLDSRNIGSGDSKEQGQVSSTRVRHALGKGDMKYVSELLGRHHRLMLMVKDQEWLISNQRIVSARKSCLLNLPPKDGLYERCSLFVGSENVVPCRVTIDATHIHLELDEVAPIAICSDKKVSCSGSLSCSDG
ncbi:hypothetical protein TEA_012882 [Camellia sinensis var. sinensis]|uniref:FAD synthase n=1 Tax=Camellia sinensis var. sinensis TaxID=542762 RepID=A0A4S4DRW3_CAMSN|nr:hypothetical protein TEA_012882 [Camellia sinensis var. sinensis]